MSLEQSPGSAGIKRRQDRPELRLEETWPQTLEEFRALVRKYQHRLVRYAFCRLGNIQDSEDVIQRVFVQAYMERHKRKKILSVGPYLYRMAANASVDHLRRNKQELVSLEDVPAEKIKGMQDNSHSAAAVIELIKIEKLLRTLPEKQAEVIRLCIVEQLGLTEVAEIFGCSVDTVKSRFRYGIEKLRRRVSRDLEVRS